MAKGCFNCARMFLFVLNFLFLVIGLGLIGFCIYVNFEPAVSIVRQDLNFELGVTLYTAIAIGAVTVVVSVFGCCGAYCLSGCQLSAYFVCLLVIVALETAGAAYIFVNREDANLRDTLTNSVLGRIANATTPEEVPQDFKNLQTVLACCGAKGYDDYANADVADKVCTTKTPGCIDKIFTMASENGKWLLCTVGGIAFLEVLSMLLSLYACCFLRNNPEYVTVAQE